MKHLFKSSVLAAAILFSSASTVPAAIAVQHRAVIAQSASTIHTPALESLNANEAGMADATPVAKKAKKAGLFQRLGAWYAKQMAGDNQIIALILSILMGYLAVDRFYLGRTVTGLLKLFTFGGFGIWYIIDVVLIATGALKPRRGEYSETF